MHITNKRTSEENALQSTKIVRRATYHRPKDFDTITKHRVMGGVISPYAEWQNRHIYVCSGGNAAHSESK